MVRNAAVEAENKIRTIKAAVQPASGRHHPKTFMVMLAVNHSIKMSGLVSSFQYKESKSMVMESMEQYSLASEEVAYEYPWERAPMGFMSAGLVFHDVNASHYWEQKHPLIYQPDLLREH